MGPPPNEFAGWAPRRQNDLSDCLARNSSSGPVTAAATNNNAKTNENIVLLVVLRSCLGRSDVNQSELSQSPSALSCLAAGAELRPISRVLGENRNGAIYVVAVYSLA